MAERVEKIGKRTLEQNEVECKVGGVAQLEENWTSLEHGQKSKLKGGICDGCTKPWKGSVDPSQLRPVVVDLDILYAPRKGFGPAVVRCDTEANYAKMAASKGH